MILLRLTEHRLDTHQGTSNHGPPENTTPQLSSPDQLPTTHEESSNGRTLLHPGALRNVSRYVTNHHATRAQPYRFLEPFTECASVSDDKDRYYTWSVLGTEGNCVCMYIRALSVIVDNKCGV